MTLALWLASLASRPAGAAPAPSGCAPTVEALPGVDPADPRLRGASLIVVRKAERRLQVFSGGRSVACFPVALAAGYVPGHKVRRGDLRTPEGWYRTSDRPWSQFYGAITVHYPRAEDARRALADGSIDQATHDAIVAADVAGVAPPMNSALGGQIVVHGGGSGADWTLGCVALEDADIDAVRALLPPDRATDLWILP